MVIAKSLICPQYAFISKPQTLSPERCKPRIAWVKGHRLRAHNIVLKPKLLQTVLLCKPLWSCGLLWPEPVFFSARSLHYLQSYLALVEWARKHVMCGNIRMSNDSKP